MLHILHGFNRNNCRVISISAEGFFNDGTQIFYQNTASNIFGARLSNNYVNLRCETVTGSGSNRNLIIKALLLKINSNPLLIFTNSTAGTVNLKITDLPSDYTVASNYTLTLNSQTGTTREYTISGLSTSGGTDTISIMISDAEGEPFYEEVYMYTNE